MNQDIINQIRIRDNFKARAKHNILARIIYKRIRNDVVKQIANAKSNYFRQKILENKGQYKEFMEASQRNSTDEAGSSYSYVY